MVTDPRITEAQAAMRRKAMQPKDPTILSVLRILRPQILEMWSAGHRGHSVYKILSQNWEWSPQAFYEAWRVFKQEESLCSSKAETLRPTTIPVVRNPQTNTTSISPAATAVRRGTAVDALTRLSVTDLLQQGT